MFKYGAISGPYYPIFSQITEKYGPEITPYLDTFHVEDQGLFWIKPSICLVIN